MRRPVAVVCVLALLGSGAIGGRSMSGQDGSATPAGSAPGLTVEMLARREADGATGRGLALYRVTFAPETSVAEHRLPGEFVLTVESGSLTVATLAGTIDTARRSSSGALEFVETIDAPAPGMIVVTDIQAGGTISADGPAVVAESSTSGEPTVVLVATTFGPGENPIQLTAAPPRFVATPGTEGGAYDEFGAYDDVTKPSNDTAVYPGSDAPTPDRDGGGTAAPTPDVAIVPAAAAPYGLAGVTLPADRAAVEARFDRFPPTLAGLARDPNPPMVDPDELGVAYGPWTGTNEFCGQPTIAAAESGTYDLPANWTAEHHVASILVEDVAQRAIRLVSGRDGTVYWARLDLQDGENVRPEGICSILIWGNAGSRWFFTAVAPNSAQFDALLAAFVAATPVP